MPEEPELDDGSYGSPSMNKKANQFAIFLYGLIALGFLSIIGFVAVLALPFTLELLLPYIRPWFGIILVRILLIGLLLAVAYALFQIRKDNQYVYGWMEVVVGATMCWVAFDRNDPNNLPMALTIAAGVYVMVRGFVNTYDARKKEQEQLRVQLAKKSG